MSSNLNWRWGETKPISAKTREGVPVTIGQLLYMDDDGYAVPASFFDTFMDIRTRAEEQKRFRDRFLGIAMQNSVGNTARNIRVATVGTFEFDMTNAPDEPMLLGQYLTSWLTPRGRFSDRTLEPCGSDVAIAKLTHLENVPAGKVYVQIKSTIIERWE